MLATICNITTINARQQTITFHRLCIKCTKMKIFIPSPHSQFSSVYCNNNLKRLKVMILTTFTFERKKIKSKQYKHFKWGLF
jgi:hypothetical protein